MVVSSDGVVFRSESFSGEVTTTSDGAALVAQSRVRYLAGGRELPVSVSSNCGVCRRPHSQIAVEDGLILGLGAKAIFTQLKEEGIPDPPSAHSIETHNNHMGLTHTIRRTAMQKRQGQLIESMEDFDGSLLDHIGLLEEVQRKAFEGIVKGDLPVSVNEGLAAAKALAALQQEAGGGLTDELFFTAIHQILELAREVAVDEAGFQMLIEMCRKDPVLASVERARRRQTVGQAEINGSDS